MISVLKLNNAVNNQISKNNGRYIEPSEMEDYINIASYELYDELLGATNKRINKQTLVGYGHNQQTDKRLEVFKREYEGVVIEGIAEVPEEIGHITFVSKSKKDLRPFKYITEDRLGNIFGNPLREPDEEEVYYTEGIGNTVEVFGTTGTCYIKYLKKPKRAKVAIKEVEIITPTRTVTRKEIDEENSVNLEWDERQFKDLLTRVVAMIANPMKDSFLVQTTNKDMSNE